MILFGLPTTVVLVLFAVGISAVITGSRIGYPIRFAWCFVFRRARPLWGMVRCPYCNAWWAGLVVAILADPSWSWLAWLQIAFTSCGVVRLFQAWLGGDGIAMVEDFDSTLRGG